MSEIGATLETVGTLLGERARFEGWLEALEAKRATMPPHVVTRVRDDYGTRLGAVLAELGTHVPALAGAAESLASRDAQLRQDEDARHDARAEAELRHAVGEFDDPTWERLRDDHDGVLARLADERRQVAGELSTVRGLLAQAEDAQRIVDAGGPLAAATAPAVVAAPTPAAVAVVDGDAADAPTSGAPVSGAPVSGAPATGAPDATPAAEATADAAADAMAGTDAPPASPDLFTPTANAAVAGAAFEGAASRDAGERPSAAGSAAPQGAVATATPAATPAAPTDPRKTLKCAECGTWNLPTEWYCEACGGELAVF